MADIQLWREAAAEMGLQGPEIIAFVREQQEIARDEHRMQRKMLKPSEKMLKLKQQEMWLKHSENMN